jgi:hypothetical protein
MRASMTKVLLSTALALILTGCGGAIGPTSTTTPPAGPTATPPGGSPPGAPQPPGSPPPVTPLPTGQDFATRCTQPGVLRCVGFESAADIAGTYGDPTGILNDGAAPMALDTTIKASGNSSLKMTVPSNSGANTSGSYWANFSDNLGTQFGENAEFYVQWRERFSPEFLSTTFQGGGGWKQAIIGAGDKPGCTASTSASGLCSSSCTALETVTQNTFQRGYPQMYNSCTGSTSHSAFSPFEEPFGSSDFKIQNARPSPYCLYSATIAGKQFPPTGNCFGYFANEWMTFTVKIKTGPRVNDEWTGSVVTLYVAREHSASEAVINFSINLSAGAPADDWKFGKVWLLPYDTGKDASQVHPTGYVWYDELIISTQPIADPQ